jgi:hypothetical protein
MPNAVFIPAELNDLSVDVALGTPAQGAVLYRGAAKWNALAAGGAGQVLTSGGINANPAWAPVSPDLSAAVVLAPNTVNRNLIQPTGDYKGLVIKNFPGQTNNPFELQDENGIVIFHITPQGITGFNSITDNTILGLSTSGEYTPTAALLQVSSLDASNNYIGEFYVDFDGSILLWSGTASGSDQRAGRLRHGMLDNNDATFKGRLLLSCHDFNGEREGLRIEADGSAARIGFLGAAAAVRQTLPAAANDPATTQTLANALRSLAITFGLAN